MRSELIAARAGLPISRRLPSSSGTISTSTNAITMKVIKRGTSCQKSKPTSQNAQHAVATSNAKEIQVATIFFLTRVRPVAAMARPAKR
ncbi:hypothetical protein D3C80_966400 [compost metagenome]